MYKLLAGFLALALLMPARTMADADIDSITVPTHASKPVPTDSWLYPLCADVAGAGYLPGHSAEEFSGSPARSELDFARLTVEVFALAQAAQAELDKMEKPANPEWSGYYSISDPELQKQREAYDEQQQRAASLQSLGELLYLRFRGLLRPTAVVLDMNNDFGGIYELINTAAEPGRERRDAEARANPESYPSHSAYDEVPKEHWAYAALDELCKDGVLQGYPPDFFNGERLLTRYEFAQAVARLLDTLVSRPELNERALRLGFEFSDQLAEMAKQVEGFSGCALPDPAPAVEE